MSVSVEKWVLLMFSTFRAPNLATGVPARRPGTLSYSDLREDHRAIGAAKAK